MTYNVQDWYWTIGSDAAAVWSSARARSVPVDDAEYLIWAAGHAATPIADMNELREVMRAQFPPGTLETYAADVRWRTNAGGIVVNGRPFATDIITLGSLNSAFIYTQSNAASTFSWKLPDGSFVTLNKQDVQELQAAVSKFGQDCFTCEAETLDAIANGTITERAEIDAAFAAVPNTFSSTAVLETKKHR